jgi:hypothetical protein
VEVFQITLEITPGTQAEARDAGDFSLVWICAAGEYLPAGDVTLLVRGGNHAERAKALARAIREIMGTAAALPAAAE